MTEVGQLFICSLATYLDVLFVVEVPVLGRRHLRDIRVADSFFPFGGLSLPSPHVSLEDWKSLF